MDSLNSTGSYPERALVITALQLMVFGALWVYKKTVLDVAKPKWVPWLILAGVMLLGALRGILFSFSLLALNIETQLNLVFRVSSSMTNTTLGIVLYTIGMTVVKMHYASKARLLTEQNRLLTLREGALQQIADSNQELILEVKHNLAESVGGLTSQPTDAALQRLRNTIDEVVRPLSHQLASVPVTWVPQEVAPRDLLIDWRYEIREALDPREIQPTPTMFFLMLVGLASFLSNYPILFGIGMVLEGYVVGLASLWLLRRLGVRYFSNKPIIVRGAYTILAFILSGLAVGYSVADLAWVNGSPFRYVPMAPVILVSSGLMIAIAARTQRVTNDIELQLQEATRRLGWEVARIRDFQRQRRRLLANKLHGQIQAGLSAAFIKLERASQSGSAEEVARITSQLETEIASNLAVLNSMDHKPDALVDVLEKTRANWEGVANITWIIQSDFGDRLALDPICLTSVNDLIPELVFNSIKHGNCSEISIELQWLLGDILVLKVSNDGDPEEGQRRFGLGSKLLDECAISWTRTSANGRTTTEVLLPYSVEGATTR